MMAHRASMFEGVDDLDVAEFTPAVKSGQRPADEVAAIRESAEKRGFASRDPKPDALVASPLIELASRKAQRRRRTGRNQQLNIKTTAETVQRFYALADGRQWGIGEAFERAVAALEQSLTGTVK